MAFNQTTNAINNDCINRDGMCPHISEKLTTQVCEFDIESDPIYSALNRFKNEVFEMVNDNNRQIIKLINNAKHDILKKINDSARQNRKSQNNLKRKLLRTINEAKVVALKEPENLNVDCEGISEPSELTTENFVSEASCSNVCSAEDSCVNDNTPMEALSNSEGKRLDYSCSSLTKSFFYVKRLLLKS